MTTLVPTGADYPVGTLAPAMSADGHYVAYTDLVDDVVGVGGRSVSEVIVRAVATPTVTSAVPSSLARGSTTTVLVTGTKLLPGVTAFTTSGVLVSNVTRLSDTQAQLTVAVAADAPLGGRVLVVLNPGTGPGASAISGGLCACLTVT